MAGALAAAELIGSLGNLALGIWSNIQNQRNYEDYKEYNSPVQQMQRYEQAGLNPNLALGQPNTVSSPPQVSNPAESLIGLGSRVGNAYNTEDVIANRKLTQDIRKSQLELEKIKTDIKSRLAQQAIAEGNLDLAMKALNYDTLVQTAPAEVSKAFAEAGIATNKRQMSDYDLATYTDYRDNIVAHTRLRNDKLEAETNYLKFVKPNLEAYKAATARLSAKWSHDDRQAQIAEAKRFHNMSYNQRQIEYDMACRKFQLAVDKQDWEQAHYWYNKVFGILGSAIKTYGFSKGIPIK